MQIGTSGVAKVGVRRIARDLGVGVVTVQKIWCRHRSEDQEGDARPSSGVAGLVGLCIDRFRPRNRRMA